MKKLKKKKNPLVPTRQKFISHIIAVPNSPSRLGVSTPGTQLFSLLLFCHALELFFPILAATTHVFVLSS